MSFFGFDPTRGKNTSSAPGFSQAPDPFAGLSRPEEDGEDALDFEDTYDGLGDQLDETDDVFNDDTFGGGGGGSGGHQGMPAPKPVGKDFDFFGQTAKVADAINEESIRYTRQQPTQRVIPPNASLLSQQYSQPARSGYERYKEPGYTRDFQADESIWGGAPKKSINDAAPPTSSVPAGGRKMMSLEEVEAAMRAQSKKPVQTQVPEPTTVPAPTYTQQSHYQQAPQQPSMRQDYPQQDYSAHNAPIQQQQQPVQILQRQQPAGPAKPSASVVSPPLQAHNQQQQVPIQILQNPNRASGSNHVPHQQQPMPSNTGPRHQGHGMPHPTQLAGLSEEERAAFLLEDAKRAKRNHKIFLLSKDNGLMTPQDKNFITRIQLQQLVTATGNPNEHGTDSSLAEDFYYQVHNQIRGGPRQTPNQPLSNFAQTYLIQTGGRHGNMRRHGRGGDNHVQRMEQQVQRAVEAAKNKPKNKQLVIEGSLGKISFSNAKTPKPLLNIKRNDSAAEVNRPGSAARAAADRKTQALTGDDRKTILQSIENVYNTLLKMEDHGRQMPETPNPDDINPTLVGLHMDWREKADRLNAELWQNLKVHEPVGATTTHPFIAFLSFAKGKKAIPRIFRHVNHEQQTTILTMIVVHLDQLDAVRLAQLASGETHLIASVREIVDLFSSAVMPSLLAYLNNAGLNIIDGIMGIILDRTNLDHVARTRIGLSMLTMILSCAELIKEGAGVDGQEWEHWVSTYNSFFDQLEPTLPFIFPGTVNTGEDVYVWQFLAAIGIGAGPEQQQRLVMSVKDRVMETVALAKTLPPALSSQRLADVNLFMRSIGLDVELLA